MLDLNHPITIASGGKYIGIDKGYRRALNIAANISDACVLKIIPCEENTAFENGSLFFLYRAESGKFVKISTDGTSLHVIGTRDTAARMSCQTLDGAPTLPNEHSTLYLLTDGRYVCLQGASIRLTSDVDSGGKFTFMLAADEKSSSSAQPMSTTRTDAQSVNPPHPDETRPGATLQKNKDAITPQQMPPPSNRKSAKNTQKGQSEVEQLLQRSNDSSNSQSKSLDEMLNKIKNNLEVHIVKQKRAYETAIELAAECNDLAEKCSTLEADMPIILENAEKRTVYENRLKELTSAFPADFNRYLEMESDISATLAKSLDILRKTELQLTTEYEIAKSRFVKLAEEIMHLQEQDNELTVEVEASNQKKKNLLSKLDKWEYENREVAKVLPDAKDIIDLLDDVKRRLQKIDTLLDNVIKNQPVVEEISYSP